MFLARGVRRITGVQLRDGLTRSRSFRTLVAVGLCFLPFEGSFPRSQAIEFLVFHVSLSNVVRATIYVASSQPSVAFFVASFVT